MRRWNRAAARVAIAVGLVSGAVAVHAQNTAVRINVNAAADRHPINSNIYGVAYASTEELNDLNAPLNRNGGNNTSRYNWLQNGDNRAQDWYFESIGDASAVAGERGDTFIADAKAANAEAMLTIPLLDWVAKLGSNRSKLASFSIAKYGPQTGNDWQWFPDAGNGIWTSGQYVVGNDPNDANVPSSSAFQQAWVQHLISQWGTNASGGLRYYILDNEPSIWHSTHRDVQPTGVTMDQMLAKVLDYAGMIKNNDASALVIGPEEWGWSGYFYSG
ncbi:MAG: cellulase, partial [Verrucomicrobia bacterium]